MKVADKKQRFKLASGNQGQRLVCELDNKGQRSTNCKPVKMSNIDPKSHDELFEIILQPDGFIIKSGEMILSNADDLID